MTSFVNSLKIKNQKEGFYNLVFYMNPSNGNSLNSDSGYIFSRNLIFPFTNSQYKFHILSKVDPNWEMVQYHYIDQGQNKYDIRLSFDCNKLRKILSNIGLIDIFYLNQSEHGTAVKSVLFSLNLNKVPILSYIHYTPLWSIKNDIPILDPSLDDGKLGKNIVRRQLETCELSERILTHSNFSKNLILKAANYYNFEIIEEKIELIPPPLDPELISLIPNIKAMELKHRILYNSRLYDHYGFSQILDLFASPKINEDIEIHITDPSGKRTSIQDNYDPSITNNRQRIKKLKGIFYHPTMEREQYLQFLKSITIGIAPYRPALWSMSVLDMIAMKIPVLAPNQGFYPEIIPKYLIYRDMEEFKTILRHLIDSSSFYNKSSKDCFRKSKQCFPSIIFQRYNKLFKEIIENNERYS